MTRPWLIPSVWIDRHWWAYLFERPVPSAVGYAGNNWITDWARRLWCRMNNHPPGPVWFNSGGLEPNMHCRDCGDDIG